MMLLGLGGVLAAARRRGQLIGQPDAIASASPPGAATAQLPRLKPQGMRQAVELRQGDWLTRVGDDAGEGAMAN